MKRDPSFITLPWKLERAPPPFEGYDIKYPEGLIRHFLKKYTKPGARVFDPFAGLGTTLFVAEEMGRVPFGVEYDSRRHAWVAGQMTHWQNLIRGDSRRLSSMGFPKMDFAMTSPPYMPNHQRWNPLASGNPQQAGYETYLRQMGRVFAQLAGIMKRGAHVAVQVDNLPGRTFTPLVRDIGLAVEKSLTPVDETVVAWKNPKPGYSHTHCLIFRKAAP